MRFPFLFVLTFFVLCHFQSIAQVPNTPKINQKEQDKLYLNRPFKDQVTKLKKDLGRTWDNIFINFTDNNTYLLAGMSFSKQTIKTGDYAASFNYNLNDFNKNVFKPGYYAGFRVDGKYKQVHNYSFAMTLNKLATGTYYKEHSSLPLFIGSFSKFKADEQFFNLSIAAHYKKLLVLGDTAKYKFYIVAGPSIETRLSEQSADNLTKNNYQRFLLRGDLGAEFDNNGYYTLFLHYKQGISSFTKAPINTNINSIELGMMIKASDLF
jgi:hypothetical protein